MYIYIYDDKKTDQRKEKREGERKYPPCFVYQSQLLPMRFPASYNVSQNAFKTKTSADEWSLKLSVKASIYQSRWLVCTLQEASE